MKKQTYTPPKTAILELNYDYDVITPGAGFFDSVL